MLWYIVIGGRLCYAVGCNTILCQDLVFHVIWCIGLLCYASVRRCYATICFVVLCCDLLWYVVLGSARVWFAMVICYVLLKYAMLMLCYAMHLHALLCFATSMLCHAMTGCAMLCSALVCEWQCLFFYQSCICILNYWVIGVIAHCKTINDWMVWMVGLLGFGTCGARLNHSAYWIVELLNFWA